MKLTQQTDYSLRVLLFLAGDGASHTIGEIAEYFGISKNHLVKVTHRLTQLGYVESIRGRMGGIRLLMKPEDIVVGEVVRHMEPNFHLVECFDMETNTCPIVGACGLKGVLGSALGAFNAHLDQYTLADFI